ncbi:MAG TPA: hypothetical protein VNO83_07665 [Pseudonocardia sp.]|nr:hypothetical protein [Pseudonocardia sp.]
MDLPKQVLAYFVDGPHGGETVVVTAESDGSPPREIELQDPVPPPELYMESSLRHSIPLVVSRYRLVQEAQRERGGYVYTLVRDLDAAR